MDGAIAQLDHMRREMLKRGIEPEKILIGPGFAEKLAKELAWMASFHGHTGGPEELLQAMRDSTVHVLGMRIEVDDE